MTAPKGKIEPPDDAVAVIVKTFIEKYAVMEWAAVTFKKVSDVTAPTLIPSTRTLSIWCPVFGVIVNTWFAP